ncbi:hypothetical protein [Plasmodium yoelii yoelii]|uniref:Uncharacterized protein n=1 Tax=Plasmodium yoelii yoelii TaxID=73239 RepID=Q7RDT8_PLAYO|nr:hypothetical protein [Plasmodium yoelii yoelii]
MMYLTKIVSNACLAIINFGLCLSLTSLSRRMLIKGYDICPDGYRGCDKEKCYLFGVIYEHMKFNKITSSYWILMILQKLHMLMPLIFSIISILLLNFVFTMDTPLHLYKSQKYDKFEEIKKKISKVGIDEKHEYHSNEKNNEINIILNDLTIIDFFRNKKLRTNCIIGSILCYLFCFSGCIIIFNNLFLFYNIFETKRESSIISMIFIFIYFLFTIITTKLANYYNNKNKLIILGFVLQLISSFIMMICSLCNLPQKNIKLLGLFVHIMQFLLEHLLCLYF